MKAIVCDTAPGGTPTLRLATDYRLPDPPPGEVRIRTTLAGICHTDLELLRGYAGFRGVLGHEFVGIVDRVGNGQASDLLGRRVVGEINVGCGTCRICQAGLSKHCPQRTALGIRGRDGALAEYFCLPAANLHPVPEELPDEAAVWTEPLAASLEILEQVPVRPTDRVVVLGDGKLGLLVAQVLALTGCHLVAVGHHDQKLGILAGRGIPTRVGSAGLEDRADLVVECTGRPEGFEEARRLVRPRGTLVLKSTFHGRVAVDLSSLAVDEITLVGSRCGSAAAALRLLALSLVDVQPLIGAIYPLDQAQTAFEHAGRRNILKVLVKP